MDQTEVTNRMYALCVKAGVCMLPIQSDGVNPYYDNARYLIIQSYTSTGMTQSSTAPGSTGGFPPKRSGKKRLAAQTVADIPGGTKSRIRNY